MYLTPWKIEDESLLGAVHESTGSLILSSLRLSTHALYKHRDPAYLFPNELQNAVSLNIDSDCAYLGHCFPHYGHFLLESLPMLGAILDSNQKGLFLP
jgi:hypothetical protein